MELHHKKHHAAYVTNLNKALEEYADAESKKDLQKMISLQGAINFNGGGAGYLPPTCYIATGKQRDVLVQGQGVLL
jgi:superoxide dismutase